MAEASAKTGGIGGWIKAGVSSVFGLASGAVLMYLTPLVNNVVKPAEPVANFGYQAQGLAVTFQNRSTNATDGWWDYGDGSPLEAYSAKQETIAHTYAKGGSYMVKLSLTNLFNDKNERVVTVNVDSSSAPAPVIKKFQVLPLSPGMPAPAVFRVVANVEHADLLVWTYDGAQKIEVTAGDVQERWVTAKEPGSYTFRLAAVAGNKIVEAEGDTQWVGMADSTAPVATVKVTYTDAVQVQRTTKTVHVPLAWKSDCKDSTCPVHGEWPALPGYQVVKAELSGDGKDPHLRGIPKVEIAPDRTKVLVNAEMVKQSGLIINKVFTQRCDASIIVTLEKRSAVVPQTQELPMAVNVPGQTKIPLVPLSGNWQATAHKVSLDLKDGSRSVWSGTDMPVNRQVTLKGRPVIISATEQGNQIVLTVTDPRVGLKPLGN